MDPVIRQVAETEISTRKVYSDSELHSMSAHSEKPRLNRFYVNVYKKLLTRDDYIALIEKRGRGNLDERKNAVRKRILILEDVYREELGERFGI